jgi:hypothetical protein
VLVFFYSLQIWANADDLKELNSVIAVDTYDGYTHWYYAYMGYTNVVYHSLKAVMQLSTVYISVIPTLLYTWHNLDVLSRLANPMRSRLL